MTQRASRLARRHSSGVEVHEHLVPLLPRQRNRLPVLVLQREIRRLVSNLHHAADPTGLDECRPRPTSTPHG